MLWARGTTRKVHCALALCALLGSVSISSFAQTGDESTRAPDDRIIRAIRINPHSPKVDGRLDDMIWQKAEFATGFTQKLPDEGKVARDQTEIAFAYDEHNLYIGARMRSTNPEGIISTMSRRDNAGNSERVIVSLDTYRDKRTAYTFAVTASGVRIDYYHPSDSETDRDYDFDPVWEAKAARTADGWAAEMRIPFGQLRFRNEDVQEWGVNVNRWAPAINEDSYWIMVPKQDNGWSSRMGPLLGIRGIRPAGRLEVMPYAASDVTMSDVDPENPFKSDQELSGRAGADIKMRLGPNLTLDTTINPDFRQVEADPAVVNLSAFEDVFEERRPFFLEGRQLLAARGATWFYSKRIGRPPSQVPDADYVDVPDATSILAAAKLTGRLNSGLNVGGLAALTARETAKIYDTTTGITTEEDAEPPTGYGVLRLQQEFGEDASTVGMIVTGTERDVSPGDNLAESLRKRAVTGATDWNLRFAGGKYEIGGHVGGSYVQGTEQAIRETQESSARHYQRPDNDYVTFDTTRTDLAGYSASLNIEKNAGKHWLWEVGGQTESPGFEINDVGQLHTADDIDSWAGTKYRETEAGKIFQDYELNLYTGTGWNYGLDRQYTWFDFESQWTWKNFMGTWLGSERWLPSQSDNLTRGGPSMRTDSGWNVSGNVWSNPARKTTWSAWTGYWDNDIGGGGYWLGGDITFRPGDRWQLTINPTYDRWTAARQYVDEVGGGSAATYGGRYIFAYADRSILTTVVRLNYAFTPNLTLELWARPNAESGRFYDFGELKAARGNELRTYGSDGTTIEDLGDGVYEVTDGGQTFQFEWSDFTEVSFQSNLVLRWEWSPGSTLFLVWQASRGEDDETGTFVRPQNLWDSITAPGDNFLAVKLTYWIPFF